MELKEEEIQLEGKLNNVLDNLNDDAVGISSALLNSAVYSNIGILRNEILLRLEGWKAIARHDCSVASCIVVDIETAIKFANFEPKEKKILKMWMEGYTQTEIADAVYEYQQNVGRVINACIRRLQYVLVFLNPYS